MAPLKEDDVIESSVFNMGKQRGEQKVLVRYVETRIGRPLTDAERATVVERLGTLGGERLGDVLFGLSPEAIATWLGRPDAA
jgi:hypothetical protein